MISVVTQLARMPHRRLRLPLPCPDLCEYFIQLKQAPLFPLVLCQANLQAKGKVEGAEQAEAENGALTGADLLLGEALEQVVAQMAHAVDEVEDKGEAEADLDEALDGKGQGGEAGDQALRLDVEAGEGRNQVGEEVGIGGAGERAAGDTRPGRGGEPGLRALVDAKMGGDGTLQALLGEDVLALGRRQVGGLDGTRRESRHVSFEEGDGNGFGIRSRGPVVLSRESLPSLGGGNARSHGQTGHVLAKGG